MGYASLFFTAFISATLFPLSSEAILATLLYHGYSPLLLWLMATSGNTLGSCVNWYLGRQFLRWQSKKWFPFSGAQIDKAQVSFQRYGTLSLLFAWLPIVGDPLTFFAGMMRIHFLKFVILVALGKALRYAIVIQAGLGFFNL